MKLEGHLGRDNTLTKVRQSCFWYNMKLDCDLHVKTCAVCNKNKKVVRHHHAPLGEYHVGAPLDCTSHKSLATVDYTPISVEPHGPTRGV